MNEQRDELIKLCKELAHPDWCLSVPHIAKGAINNLIAALEAATPRTITTVEELDALAVGSVVLSEAYAHSLGKFLVTFQRWRDGDWHRPARNADTHPDNILPATVLYEPTP